MADVIRGLLIGDSVYWSERVNTQAELEDEFRAEVDDCDRRTMGWRAYPPNDNYLADLSEWNICGDWDYRDDYAKNNAEHRICTALSHWRRKMVICQNEVRRIYDQRIFACYGKAICVGDSEIIVREGGAAHVFDRTRCIARENAMVYAYDQSIIEARDNARVVAYGQCVVETQDDATVTAYEGPAIVMRGRGDAIQGASGNINLIVLEEVAKPEAEIEPEPEKSEPKSMGKINLHSLHVVRCEAKR